MIPFQSQGGALPGWLTSVQLPALPEAPAVVESKPAPAAASAVIGAPAATPTRAAATMAQAVSIDADVQMKQVESIAGVVGKAGRFAEGSQLVVAKPLIQPKAGSVAFWCRLPQSTAQTKNMHFIGSGQNNPSWFSVSANEGKLAFLFKNGRQPFSNPGEFYNSISMPIDWKADEWHHVAVTWDAGDLKNPGVGKLRIFIDGKRVEHRDNANLSDVFTSDSVMIGRSSASAKVIYLGDLDEVILAPTMVSDEQIAELVKAQRAGKPGVDIADAKVVTFDPAPSR
jgi:hypothetical protein